MAAKKRFYDNGISGKGAEREGGDMMPGNDTTSFSNMPQNVMMKPYPKTDYVDYPNYPDTYSETDAVVDKEVRMTRKERSDTKY